MISPSSTTIVLNNLRPNSTWLNNQFDKSKALFALLTADSHSGMGGSLVPNVLTPVIPQMRVWFETIKSGRIYIGYGEFNNPPTPGGSDYFGWIELSRTSTDDVVWINLSNVDILGLPITLRGVTSSGNDFTLGYKTPIVAPPPVHGQPAGKGIIDDVKSVLTDNANGKSAALITTSTGQTKVLAPNHVPASYRSYTPYVNTLIGKTNKNGSAPVPLKITSDAPKNGSAITFNGHFHAEDSGNYIITLTSTDGTKVFKIKKGDLTTQIIYQCDGGYIYYSTNSGASFTKYPQNRTAANDPSSTAAEQTITNSVFREIMIGLNEGYFSADTASNNDNSQFPGLVPFASGYGNQYAQVIHNNSNSYGFPYADSNLKVLITAEIGADIFITAIPDDEAHNYQAPPDNSSNQPQSGTYQLGIGSNSQALGTIKIGNWRYLPNNVGGYGGWLPDLPDWTKMEFTGLGADKYIWIKNGAVTENTNGVNCLTQTCVISNDVLVWGAGLSWNGSTAAPANPS